MGDIYKGVVTAVLPGIQAAFVDIGADKAAFPHVSDLIDPNEEDEELGERRRGANGRQLPAIQDVLKKGMEILVQVTTRNPSPPRARASPPRSPCRDATR